MKGKVLNLFVKEVVQEGTNAILPQNISDNWMGKLMEEAQNYMPKNEIEKASGLKACVLAIMNESNEGEEEITVSSEEMNIKIRVFICNLSIDDLTRKTNINLVSCPTIKNVLDEKTEVVTFNPDLLNNKSKEVFDFNKVMNAL